MIDLTRDPQTWADLVARGPERQPRDGIRLRLHRRPMRERNLGMALIDAKAVIADLRVRLERAERARQVNTRTAVPLGAVARQGRR